MAAIEHYSAEITSVFTYSDSGNSWVDIPGLALASSNFTVGDQYLLVCSQPAIGLHSNTNSGEYATRILHGATAFEDSHAHWEQHNQNNDRTAYLWFSVWTAVTSEGLKAQCLKTSASHDLETDNAVLAAVNLDNGLTQGTDWYYAESSTATILNTTWSTVDNASITFTPAAASVWGVLAGCRNDIETLTINTESRISAQGDVADVAPFCTMEGEDTDEQMAWTLARSYSLTNTSNTFTQQSRLDGTGGASDLRSYSKILAINLDKFDAKAAYWSEASISVSTDVAFSVELASQPITPTATSDVLVFTQWMYDYGGTNSGVNSRGQIDDSDDPATQTADAYNKEVTRDDTDERLVTHMTMASSLAASAHTIDLDVGAENDLTDHAEDISVIAFTMELAANGAQTVQKELADSFVFAGNPVRDFWGDRSQTDSFVPSDNLNPLRHLIRRQSDTATFADLLTPQVLFLRLLADSATFSDNQLRDFVGTRTLDESIALTESLARDLIADRALQQSLGFSEQHLVERWLDRLTQESIVLSEQIARDGVFTRDLQDVITFAENLDNTTTGGNQTVSKTLQDVFTFIDNLLTGKTTNRSTSDAFTFVDQTLRTAVFTRSVTDSVTFTDSPLTDLVLDRQLQDSLTLAENLAWNTARLRQIADEFNLTEQIVRDLILDRVLTDTLTLTENFVVTGAEAPAAAAEHWRLFTHHKWALRRRLWRRFMDLDHYPPS